MNGFTLILFKNLLEEWKKLKQIHQKKILALEIPPSWVRHKDGGVQAKGQISRASLSSSALCIYP
jgi:hypothetical protein